MRTILNKQMKQYKNTGVALAFSGGMDSLSLLLSCLDVGIRPHLYTVRLESFVSNDIKASRRIAEIYGLEITEVVIEESIEYLLDDIEFIIKNLQTKLKTKIQCLQLFYHMLQHVKEPILLSGLCADDLYGTSKNMRIVCSKDTDLFEWKRRTDYANPDASAYSHIKKLCGIFDVTLVAPYKDNKELADMILAIDPKELHKPKEKNLTYQSFKTEIERDNLFRKNANMQCDSRIREYHNTLLKTELNQKGFKSVTGIYNQLYKEIWADDLHEE